jgi:hypothetical protein
MRLKRATIGLLLGLGLAAGSTAHAAGHDADLLRDARIEHVLLISVDGLHALDVARFVENHPSSAMAELAARGITYSNASTPANPIPFRAAGTGDGARRYRAGCSYT